MQRRIALALWMILSTAYVLASPAPAQAQVAKKAEPVRVRMSFDVPLEEQPNRLCLMSTRQDDEQSASFGVFTRTTAPPAPATGGAAAPADSWSYKVAAGAPQLTDQLMKQIVEHLERSTLDDSGQGRCESDACRPRIEVPASAATQYRVTCTENQQARGQPRTLFLLLEFHRSKTPTISDPYLAGTAASFTVEGFTDRTFISAQVVGGDFLRGSPVYFAPDLLKQESATIPLTIRCRRHEIALPSHASRLTRVRATVFGAKDEASRPLVCADVPVKRGLFFLMLPNGRDGEVKTVAIASGTPGEDGFARFSTSWAGITPPALLQVQTTAASFSWRKQCLQRVSRCPEVSLVATGQVCRERKTSRSFAEVCRYTCGADEPTSGEPDISLPAELRFRNKSPDRPAFEETWQDSLNGIDSAPLSSYVRGPDRSIILSMPPAIRNTTAGSAIKSISLRTSTTDYQTIAVTQNDQRVALPNADCHDTLEYRYLGDRSFADDKIEIRRRFVELPSPSRTVRPFGVGVFVGGAFAGPIARSHRQGVDEVPHAFGGTVGGSLGYRGWNNPVGIEGHLTWTITSRAYYPSADATATVTPSAVAYQRWALMPLVTVLPWHGFLVGAGFGGVLSLPTSKSDFRIAGGTQFSPIAALVARVRMAGGLWVEGSTQLIPVERYFKFESDPAGSPTVAQERVATGQLTLGLRYEFPVLLTQSAVE